MNRDNSTGVGSWGIGSPRYPNVYDRFTVNNANTKLLTFPNYSVSLGNQLVSGKVFFSGPATSRSKLYAPNPYRPGSSYSHLDEATFPRGNANALMTPGVAAGEGIAGAGPIALRIFRDSGWSIPGLAPRHDLTGDRKNDLIARTTAGKLFTYPGNGFGGFRPRISVGNGFKSVNALVLPGDTNGDGKPDLIGRAAGDGSLTLYRGNGAGGLSSPKTIGTGFNVYNTLLAPGDWNNDRKADLIGRAAGDGSLWLYPGNGRGGFGARVKIASSWGAFTAIVAPGDWNGDGATDLIARKANGTLWMFRGNGKTGFLGSSQIATGWNAFTAIVAPGPWNSDGTSDLIVRKADGSLWMYRGNGLGGFLGSSRIATGFGAMNLIA
jgi:hypothetical protein